jgi:hypothetical protein
VPSPEEKILIEIRDLLAKTAALRPGKDSGAD